ncbi:hypothetical protein BSK66_07775 [Paenibacillus odorifer]|uniref:Uncharacterized protein n=2 Tax=Paenibacillus odorifer TaxID=189426 RepID=A0A1R0X2W5_9BACL|nr:sigma-70 family RNA polymerase sigma factor [Paenibacillus sp. FSL H8-237]ETT64901.1 hypothetical protein C171_07792 [Paenibacillus sp. FSL H8-237]OMD27458.1 hypothetical protein BJP51_25005 [Paenibacillus odorifer]OME61020.1 hypothetical protein BSK66_07775 [Paenibacillus odorifer]
MNFEKLNKLAAAYLADGTDGTFSEMYKEAGVLFRQINRSRIVFSRMGDANDADELLDSVILKVITKSSDNFGSLLLKALREAQLDYFKTEQRRRKRFELSIDNESPNSEVMERDGDERPVETAVELRQRKKRTDQLKLIDSLTRSAKTDTATTTIVEAYLFAPLDAKPTEIARSLGIHHETVKRKLRRLARRYDANRFGDVREYLAV